MAETLLWTYQDAVEWVLDAQNANEPNSGAAQRLARKAVQEAYRDLANACRWTYLERRYSFVASAPYSTGTVVYDHTGGSYERMLTLTTGTWPSWAAFGRVIISDVHYDVATRESDSIITLSPTVNPGADVASTTYQIYRDNYPLPVDFRNMRLVRNNTEQLDLDSLEPDVAFANTMDLQTPGDPLNYTISGDGEYYGSLGLHLSPPPSSADQYTIWYERAMRPLKTYLYSTGLVTVSAGATTVSMATGAFNTTKHVGCVIRFGDATNLPTSDYGTIDGTDNPYVAQRVLSAIASTSIATIDSAASSSALTSVKYTISDPLEFEHQAMLTAFCRLAEAAYARLTNNKTYPQKRTDAQYELRQAMAQDWRSREMSNAGGSEPADDYDVSRFATVHLSES